MMKTAMESARELLKCCRVGAWKGEFRKLIGKSSQLFWFVYDKLKHPELIQTSWGELIIFRWLAYRVHVEGLFLKKSEEEKKRLGEDPYIQGGINFFHFLRGEFRDPDERKRLGLEINESLTRFVLDYLKRKAPMVFSSKLPVIGLSAV